MRSNAGGDEIIGLFGRDEQQGAVVVTPLEVGDVYARLKRGGVKLVDVRSKYEFESMHIKGARHVPPSKIRADETGLKPDADIIVICSNGDRAAHQAKRLAKKGFTRVAYMSGGIKAWRRAGLPVRGTQVR